MFYVNDVGAYLKNRFRLHNAGFPQNMTPMNISGLISATTLVVKPSGTLITANSNLYTDGTDGFIRYITVSGDLSEAGLYTMQGIISTPSGYFYSDTNYFQVLYQL